MVERYRYGVQGEETVFRAALGPVFLVTDDRMADGGELHPYLMRPTGQEFDRKE